MNISYVQQTFYPKILHNCSTSAQNTTPTKIDQEKKLIVFTIIYNLLLLLLLIVTSYAEYNFSS